MDCLHALDKELAALYRIQVLSLELELALGVRIEKEKVQTN